MSELPIGRNFTPEQLGELFVAVEVEPYGNPELGYRLMLPKDWRADPVQAETPELNTLHLKPLGVFFGAPRDGSPPYLQVQAARLPRSISAANWLRHFALMTERQFEALVEISPQFADSQMRFNIAGLPFRGRAAARIDGDRVFLIFGFAALAASAALEETFGVAVASFELLHEHAQDRIEPHLSASGPGGLRFDYPASWRLLAHEQPPAGRAAVDLYNFDDEESLNGLLRLTSMAKPHPGGLAHLAERLFAELREANLTIGAQRAQPPIAINRQRFANAHQAIYDASIAESGSRQELRIVLFEDRDHDYAAALLTPTLEERFYVWAINQRAYQIVLESLA